MKIVRIETGEVSIPLITPFKTAERTATHANDILVRIVSESGKSGFGEAPPTAVITGDTRGSIRCAVEEFIAPGLIGMDIEDMDGLQRKLRSCIVGNSSARAAVDMALYDLWAKEIGQPLYKLLGGHTNVLETNLTISVNPIEDMVLDSLKAVQRGFRRLKLKVGKEGEKDVERIAAIREAVGPDIRLLIDANQGWNTKTALRIIHMLEDRVPDIDLIEQPVPAVDFMGMQMCTAASSIPILADESVFTPADAVRVIEGRAADIINIKLMKCGGIYEALKICGIAESYGVECMVGCMLESKIAVSAAAHFAAAKSNVTRVDLDGPSLLQTDPYEGGPVFDGPNIRLTDDPGTGIISAPCF